MRMKSTDLGRELVKKIEKMGAGCCQKYLSGTEMEDCCYAKINENHLNLCRQHELTPF